MAVSALVTLISPLNVVTILVVYYVLSSIATWYRLRHLNGPWLGKFSHLYMFRAQRSGRYWDIYTKLNKKYGPLVRIGPNDLITDDPDIIRRMSGARSKYKRSTWYKAMKLNPHEDSMFSMLNTAEHDDLKARAAFGYTGKENPTLEGGIDSQIGEMVSLLRRKYLSTSEELKPMDFGRVAQYLTLDTITKIAYGEAFGYLRTDSDIHEYIKTTEQVVPVFQACADVLPLQRIMFSRTLLRLMGPTSKDKKGLGRLMRIAEELVSSRLAPDAKDERDMLGAFIRHGLSRKECETEVLFQIIAGSDTTATAIRATFLYTLATPSVYAAIKREISEAVKNRQISSPITHEEAKKLPYLQALIYEGLRMNAPFTGLMMKEVPPEGDTLHGKFIPGGTHIAHNTWGVLRLESVFGQDADLFRPERWLQADAAQRSLMEKTTELAFGYGRWGCLGKPVAFIELNKIYVELLRNFDFQIIYPGRPWVSMNHGLFLQTEMWVRVTEASIEAPAAT